MDVPIPESGHGGVFLFAGERHFASSFSALTHFNYFRPSPRKHMILMGILASMNHAKPHFQNCPFEPRGLD